MTRSIPFYIQFKESPLQIDILGTCQKLAGGGGGVGILNLGSEIR